MMAPGMTTAASLANAFAGDYLGALLDVPPVPTAIVFIAVLTLVNLRGMKRDEGVVNREPGRLGG